MALKISSTPDPRHSNLAAFADSAKAELAKLAREHGLFIEGVDLGFSVVAAGRSSWSVHVFQKKPPKPRAAVGGLTQAKLDDALAEALAGESTGVVNDA